MKIAVENGEEDMNRLEIRSKERLDEVLEQYACTMDALCYETAEKKEDFFAEQQSIFKTRLDAPRYTPDKSVLRSNELPECLYRKEFRDFCKELKEDSEKRLQEMENRLHDLKSMHERSIECSKVYRMIDQLKSEDFWAPADVAVVLYETQSVLHARDGAFVKWMRQLSALMDSGLQCSAIHTWGQSFGTILSAWSASEEQQIARHVLFQDAGESIDRISVVCPTLFKLPNGLDKDKLLSWKMLQLADLSSWRSIRS